MKTRLITAAIGIPLIILALIQPWVYVWGVIVLALSVTALYEFYKATGITENKSLCILGYIGAVYFVGCVFYPLAKLPFTLWYPGILVLLMLIFNKTITLSKISIVFMSILYIPYLLTNIIFLRGANDGNGQYYIWLVVIITFLTDSCAYFVGKGLGKHKLCPVLSPNKTIEGAIGGLLGGGLSALLFGYIINSFFDANVQYLSVFILGLIGAVAAQLGDITASCIKRQYGIKDYGSIFPGHGGVLDRIDSILFVAPVMYVYLAIFGIF